MILSVNSIITEDAILWLFPFYTTIRTQSSETVKKELWHRTLHIAFPKKINKNQIENVCISYPTDSLEQTRIGNFFRNLDTLITQHQRKLDKLVLIKKAMLGKMFV